MLKFNYLFNDLCNTAGCKNIFRYNFNDSSQIEYTKSLIKHISNQQASVKDKVAPVNLKHNELLLLKKDVKTETVQFSLLKNHTKGKSEVSNDKLSTQVHSMIERIPRYPVTNKRVVELEQLETSDNLDNRRQNSLLFNVCNRHSLVEHTDTDDTLQPILPYLNQSQSIEYSIKLIKEWYNNLDIRKLHPSPKPSLNLAPYVFTSFTLTQLVHLNVDLSKVQLVPGVSEFLIKADFRKEIEPILWKLSDFGFQLSDIARIITASPKILQLSLDELTCRLCYYVDRKFSPTALVDMLFKFPVILEMPVIDVDRKLGEIKDLLRLENDQLRQMVIVQPKIIIHPLPKIKDSYVIVTKMMGFDNKMAQSLFKSNPSILVSERERLNENFLTLHVKLDLSLDMIKLWPETLTAIPHVLIERSTFLVKRGLFQPDPNKPLYTPLNEVVSLEDCEFCSKIAHTTEKKYDQFLRSL